MNPFARRWTASGDGLSGNWPADPTRRGPHRRPVEHSTPLIAGTYRRIYRALRRTEALVADRYPELGRWLPESIAFVHAEDLEARYPDLTPPEREHRIAEEHGRLRLRTSTRRARPRLQAPASVPG
ncbi:MAG: hypothetical protein AB1806_15415 [Acidobacteriota bacterium]